LALIIGVTFICCVLFFPGGVWGHAAKAALGTRARVNSSTIKHLQSRIRQLVRTE